MRAPWLLGVLLLGAPSCSGKANPNDPRTCPAGQPALGGICEVDGLVCSYGASCGASVKCAAGAWTKSDVGCGTTDAGACPPTVPRDGEPCTVGAIICTYPCGDAGTLSASCTGSSWKLTASGCALPK